jgi:hypothetical protein
MLLVKYFLVECCVETRAYAFITRYMVYGTTWYGYFTGLWLSLYGYFTGLKAAFSFWSKE